MTAPGSVPLDLDEVRAITLPPPQTGAVNRLLREEAGWVLLEVRVTDRGGDAGGPTVTYVLGHRRAADAPADGVAGVAHTT
jgi:hypothetical protein